MTISKTASASRIYTFLLLFTCLFLTVAGRQVNCREHVMDSLCRGAWAKRYFPSNEENALYPNQREGLHMDKNALKNELLLLEELLERNVEMETETE